MTRRCPMLEMYLTTPVRSTRSTRDRVRSVSRRASLSGALCVAGLLPLNAYGVESKDVNYYKLYAHSRLIDSKQYQCIDELYTHESHWNPHSRNGNHYGIPQLANSKIRYLDAYSQIDWGIRYIKDRYKTPCLALAHWRKYSWH
jgi:hypothetical protein